MDTEPNNSEQNVYEHFSFSHLAMVGFTALVLLAVAWLKGDLNFPIKNQISSTTVPYSLAQAQADASKQINTSGSLAQEDPNAQLALIDANFGKGSVLGDSTNTADSVFKENAVPIPDEMLSAIPVITINSNTPEDINLYLQQFSEAEYGNDAPGILAALSTSDVSQLQSVAAKVEQLSKALLQIPVPSKLSNYHRLKMLYYVELGELCKSYLGDKDAQDPDNLTEQIFSTIQALNAIRQDSLIKYGVQL